MQCSVSVVDDEQIREVNRESLEHDWETDVVSFVIEANEQFVDGEVIASLDTAARLAAKAGWEPKDELLLYIVHGMLHVAGLDDIEDEERAIMRAKEIECLTAIGVDAQHLPERWDEVV
jgi:probable rRNA maturation factor